MKSSLVTEVALEHLYFNLPENIPDSKEDTSYDLLGTSVNFEFPNIAPGERIAFDWEFENGKLKLWVEIGCKEITFELIDLALKALAGKPKKITRKNVLFNKSTKQFLYPITPIKEYKDYIIAYSPTKDDSPLAFEKSKYEIRNQRVTLIPITWEEITEDGEEKVVFYYHEDMHNQKNRTRFCSYVLDEFLIGEDIKCSTVQDCIDVLSNELRALREVMKIMFELLTLDHKYDDLPEKEQQSVLVQWAKTNNYL